MNGVSLLLDDAIACRNALSMSSCSCSGLAMQELVHWNWKEFRIAPKTVSSGKAEQQVMPWGIHQRSGLPKSSMVVRNVASIA